jgi:glycosyltransferase involved in cell wall biosynthesis
VVLPYYDKKDWKLVKTPKDYIAYMGRITADKGITTVGAIAEARPDWKFKVAGSGNITPFSLPKNVQYMGTLPGKDRAKYMGNASVLLCPSEYVEPCAGVVCEAALTGTPAVGSSWGGYTETIEGRTGATASTLSQWIEGIEFAQSLDRQWVHDRAVDRFSLEAATRQYAQITEQLIALHTPKGWYAGV